MITLTLYAEVQGHAALRAVWAQIKPLLANGKRLTVKVEEERRTNEQNAAQWPVLEAFARQKRWPVNGELVYMDADDWKDVLTAAFRKELGRVAKGIDGGIVLLGARTSKFRKGEFSNWLEFLYATAAHMEVDIERK